MKKILSIIFLIPILIIFFHINEINYEKHVEIKLGFVKHPENLPTKEVASHSAF